MRMYDVIKHKRAGNVLSREEICFFVEGFTSGDIPDYQAAAFLMAIYFQGMNEEETAILTDCMARSGNMVDLSSIPGVKVDKHSTGGVGDKTSMIIGPIVAACGVPVAKMSGRGLGFSGGTVDKLEAIPGFLTSLSKERFFEIVKEIGVALIGQSENIAPADKKIYALRDVTATVENISLIASSIMSKKLAAGSDAILLDVKTGSGAFMKTLDDSIALAKAMVSIGVHNGRRMMALVTDMDVPLGNAIGSSIEVIEAVETLQGRGPQDLMEICLALAANMLVLAGAGSVEECLEKAQAVIDNGEAFKKFCAMTKAQGGDSSVLENTALFEKARVIEAVLAPADGYIVRMDTEQIGTAAVALGAGRIKKGDDIDFCAGIMLEKKTGDLVKTGDTIAYLHTSKQETIEEARELFIQALEIADTPPPETKHILARITAKGMTRF